VVGQLAATDAAGFFFLKPLIWVELYCSCMNTRLRHHYTTHTYAHHSYTTRSITTLRLEDHVPSEITETLLVP